MTGHSRILAYEPTIVLNPPDNAKLSQLKVFGPVVAVYTYEDRHEAIQQANAPEAAFQATIFTDSLEIALDTSKTPKRSHGSCE